MKYFFSSIISFLLGLSTSYIYDIYKSSVNQLYVSKVQFIHLDSEINRGREVLNMELYLNKTKGTLFNNFKVFIVAKDKTGEFLIISDTYNQVINEDILTFDILRNKEYPKLYNDNGQLTFKTIIINPERSTKNDKLDFIKKFKFDDLFIRYQYSYDSNLITKEIKFDHKDVLAMILNSPNKSHVFQEYKKH